MIQRPQSILLFLAALSLLFTLFSPLWVSGSGASHFFLSAWETGQYLEDGTKEVLKVNYHIVGMAALAIGMILFAVFKYKKRLLQMKLCSVCSLLTMAYAIVVIMWGIPEAQEFAKAEGQRIWVAYVPFLSVVLISVSKFLINRDEKLVRSVDRMR